VGLWAQAPQRPGQAAVVSGKQGAGPAGGGAPIRRGTREAWLALVHLGAGWSTRQSPSLTEEDEEETVLIWAAHARSDGYKAPRGWTVFQIPSTRTVSQTPSTPRGRENAISGASHGSPERRRLPKATAYGVFAPATAPPSPQFASTVRRRRALPVRDCRVGLGRWTVHDSRIRFLLGHGD